MSGSANEPVVRRNSLYVLEVLEPVVPGADSGRKLSSILNILHALSKPVIRTVRQ
jgi:hypothetical protein